MGLEEVLRIQVEVRRQLGGDLVVLLEQFGGLFQLSEQQAQEVKSRSLVFEELVEEETALEEVVGLVEDEVRQFIHHALPAALEDFKGRSVFIDLVRGHRPWDLPATDETFEQLAA